MPDIRVGNILLLDWNNCKSNMHLCRYSSQYHTKDGPDACVYLYNRTGKWRPMFCHKLSFMNQLFDEEISEDLNISKMKVDLFLHRINDLKLFI